MAKVRQSKRSNYDGVTITGPGKGCEGPRLTVVAPLIRPWFNASGAFASYDSEGQGDRKVSFQEE